MNIAFRVDASDQIGTGHFMRCLTLADALKQRGAQIRFISQDLPMYLQEMLTAKALEFVSLAIGATPASIDDLVHAHWLGASQAQDAQATVQTLSGQMFDWLVVDHYALDYRWESVLRGTAKRIMVIDDIADRRHDCDVLLDQNFYADMDSRYIGRVPDGCQLLLGPRYALLRDEFIKLHQLIKLRSGPVKRLFVFFGGVDADNYTGLVVEALSGLDIPVLHVDVVVGVNHPNLIQIKTACDHHGYAYHVQTDKMGELMAAADMAIGAGGAASWERCCLSLPTVIVAVADNQINIAKGLDSVGAAVYIGTSAEVNIEIVQHAIIALANRGDLVKELSSKAFSLVDGLGVERVCQTMRC